MKRLLIFLMATLACSVAWGDIDVRSSYKLGEPIVVKVTCATMPEGAVLRKAKFVCPGATFIKVDESTFHVWAPQGSFTITAKGMWRQYQEITDKNDKSWQVILDEDEYEYEAKFTVGDAIPVPPPVPPVPPGVRKAVILEESGKRTPAVANLILEIQSSNQPVKILDDDQQEAQQYLPQVKDKTLPLLLVVTEAAGQLVRAVPLPSTVAGIRDEVAKP